MSRAFAFGSVVALLAFSLSIGAPPPADTAQKAAAHADTAGKAVPTFKTVKVKKWTFCYAIDGANLVAKVSYPTKGWVAIGFGSKRKMEGANIVIGSVSDKGVQIENDYGVAPTDHRPKTEIFRKDMIRDGNVTQENGVTTIYFTIPLDDGDPKDAVIVPGKEMPVLFAAGRGPNITVEHADATKTKLAL